MKNIWITTGIRGTLEWYREDGQWCVSRASSPLTFGKGASRDEALADLLPSYRARLDENRRAVKASYVPRVYIPPVNLHPLPHVPARFVVL